MGPTAPGEGGGGGESRMLCRCRAEMSKETGVVEFQEENTLQNVCPKTLSHCGYVYTVIPCAELVCRLVGSFKL